jgi:hypothetical protein
VEFVAVDPTLARKLVAGLDAEMERRWLAADPSGLTALAGILNRLVAQIERGPVAGATRHDDPEAAEAFDDLLDNLDELICQAEKLADREEDEAAGIERHGCVVRNRVRSTPKVIRPSAVKPSPADAKVKRRGPEPAASAPSTPTSAPPQADDGWRLGFVERFDQ